MTDMVEIKIASTTDEILNAFALREQIFVGDEGLDYHAEFDGNDFCATHLIARINQKTVGTMRIRYFKDFVKFERVCVVKEYRKTNVSKLMMDSAAKFCAAKGYSLVHGVCKKELLPRWAKINAFPIEGAPVSVQHGMTLIAIEQQLPPAKQTINIKSSPETLNTKEGDWFEDMPIFGTFELEAKAQPSRFDELTKKVKLLKTLDDKDTPDWHPPLKAKSHSR